MEMFLQPTSNGYTCHQSPYDKQTPHDTTFSFLIAKESVYFVMHGDKTEIFYPLLSPVSTRTTETFKEGSEGSVIGPFPACPRPS